MKVNFLFDVDISFWMYWTSSFVEYGFKIDFKALKVSPNLTKESGMEDEAIFRALRIA